jgi:hypothetical protein
MSEGSLRRQTCAHRQMRMAGITRVSVRGTVHKPDALSWPSRCARATWRRVRASCARRSSRAGDGQQPGWLVPGAAGSGEAGSCWQPDAGGGQAGRWGGCRGSGRVAGICGREVKYGCRDRFPEV